jgi:hypothetical protein
VSPLIRVVAAIVVDALLVMLLFLQVRPGRRSETGLMMRGAGAITEVSIESARDRILKAISDVPDVVTAEVKVKPVRGRADLDLEVEVLGDHLRLPQKQQEINRALKQVINKQLGLQMAGRPRVHIKLYGEAARKPTLIPPLSTSTPVVPAVGLASTSSDVQPVVEAPVKKHDEAKPLSSFFAGKHDDELKSVDNPVESEVLKPDTSSDIEAAEKSSGNVFGIWRRAMSEKDKPEEIPAANLTSGSKSDLEVDADTVVMKPSSDKDSTVKLSREEELTNTIPGDFVEPETQSDAISYDADDLDDSDLPGDKSDTPEKPTSSSL